MQQQYRNKRDKKRKKKKRKEKERNKDRKKSSSHSKKLLRISPTTLFASIPANSHSCETSLQAMNHDSSTRFLLFSSVKAKKKEREKISEREREKKKTWKGRKRRRAAWSRVGEKVGYFLGERARRVARSKRGLVGWLPLFDDGVTHSRWLSFLTQRCKRWLHFLPLPLLCDFSHNQSPQQLAVCTSFALIGAKPTDESIFIEASRSLVR